MHPVMREEVVQSSEYNDWVAKDLLVIDKLHDEVVYNCDGWEHAFGLDHYITLVVKFVENWLLVTSIDEWKVSIDNLTKEEVFQVAHEDLEVFRLPLILEGIHILQTNFH